MLYNPLNSHKSPIKPKDFTDSRYVTIKIWKKGFLYYMYTVTYQNYSAISDVINLNQ